MKNKIIAAVMAGGICFSAVSSLAPGVIPAHAYTLVATLRKVTVPKETIAAGESVQLGFDWSNGAKPELEFSSSDESIAVVDENGLVSGKSGGTAEIGVTVKTSGRTLTVTVNVSEDAEKSVVYNASELSLGDKLKKYDTIHYDGKNIGSCANIVNSKGNYDLAFISEEDYMLPFDAEVVGFDGLYIYLAPAIEGVTYIDGRKLSAGDRVERSSHLLCYDYVINKMVYPVFLPEYYGKYIGEGEIRVKAIDHDKKTITLEAVPNEDNVKKGDINGDNEINVADLLKLQKWIIAEEADMKDWNAADLCEDGVVDIFDLIALRKLLTENSADMA